MDVMYLRPGVRIDWMSIREDGTCVGVTIVYADDVETGQTHGCGTAREAAPLGHFKARDVVETEDGWLIVADGADIADLVPMLWDGWVDRD